jgi:23S rRNA (adenine2503-C2)-methyltransferase
MGEPALNPAVLDVLGKLPSIYQAPGLMPCIATIAPRESEQSFESLFGIKQKFYSPGRFQLQFSINTTDEIKREKIIPFPKWDFSQIARYGDKFVKKGDRKITLNFAITQDYPVEPAIIWNPYPSYETGRRWTQSLRLRRLIFMRNPGEQKL